jgi:hypothetical protein
MKPNAIRTVRPNRMATILLLVLVLVLPFSETRAQQADTTFFVVGKGARFYQDPQKNLELWRYHVFAEVFLTKEGKLSNLSVTLPGPDGTKIIPHLIPTKSKLVNDVYKFADIHFTSEEALNKVIPNGVYTINYETPSGNVRDRTVKLDGARIPPSPIVSLFQNDKEASPDAIDPDTDLLVSWSEWPGGAPDPNHILDDLIFVAAHHCNRDYAIHSGRPFEGTDFLTYTAKDFRINAEQIEPGRAYTLFVEFADLVDTNSVDGIEGLATYTNQTYVTFTTTGQARHVCPN